MVSQSLPSPPAEDSSKSGLARKNTTTVTKSNKLANRISKRANSTISTAHDHVTMDGRHKRVWKACERCRMKKTKCDGEFPCKRCKDDGMVCTAGVRKKVEYKQLPKGYAEVLENTQFALIATVHKLYAMVRSAQSWELGEPELNDRGQPVIHNIAQKLGCIRPNSDIDLPVHSVFPEDEAGMAALARQLEDQQQQLQHQLQQQPQQHHVPQHHPHPHQNQPHLSHQQQHQQHHQQQQQHHHHHHHHHHQQQRHPHPQPPPQRQPLHPHHQHQHQHAHQHQHQHQHQQQQQQNPHQTPADPSGSFPFNRTERASSSELDPSDSELDYHPHHHNRPPTLPHDFHRASFVAGPSDVSPRASSSTATTAEFDFSPTTAPDLDAGLFAGSTQSPSVPGSAGFPVWALAKHPPASDEMTMHLMQQAGMTPGGNGLGGAHDAAVDDLGQALVQSDFATIKPDILSRQSHPDVMMGMGDPMICSDFDDEAMPI
ncbi:hypothetical protein XA68_17385 [Ophiocordyceps unilateralis]|uniref:Zn(2)-C6 fungal-type domain-containing protein n=1 Tax=Ophiocordyceps unilateralis TaxID=268505 RepID=A0A2A9P3B0_OPHUN|nr:hypothetical protein XA68_17385 [Ophiocordyceps unilateralis]